MPSPTTVPSAASDAGSSTDLKTGSRVGAVRASKAVKNSPPDSGSVISTNCICPLRLVVTVNDVPARSSASRVASSSGSTIDGTSRQRRRNSRGVSSVAAAMRVRVRSSRSACPNAVPTRSRVRTSVAAQASEIAPSARAPASSGMRAGKTSPMSERRSVTADPTSARSAAAATSSPSARAATSAGVRSPRR